VTELLRTVIVNGVVVVDDGVPVRVNVAEAASELSERLHRNPISSKADNEARQRLVNVTRQFYENHWNSQGDDVVGCDG
jgi:hypothetical protein